MKVLNHGRIRMAVADREKAALTNSCISHRPHVQRVNAHAARNDIGVILRARNAVNNLKRIRIGIVSLIILERR